MIPNPVDPRFIPNTQFYRPDEILNYVYDEVARALSIKLSGSLILSGSDIQIEAVEIKDALTDARASISQYGLTNALNMAVVDNAGNQITSFGSPSTIADYRSPADFSATFASASMILLSGYNFQLDTGAQIVYIRQRKSDNTANVYVNGASGYAFYLSSDVITMYKGGVTASAFVSGDMYEVGINSATKAYDLSSDSLKTFQNNYPVQPIDGELLNAVVATTASGTGFAIMVSASAYGEIKYSNTASVLATGSNYPLASYVVVNGGNNDAIIRYDSALGAHTIVNGGSGYITTASYSTTPAVVNYYPSSDGLDIGYYRNLSIQYKTNPAFGTCSMAIEFSNEDAPTKWLNGTRAGYISAGVNAGSTGFLYINNEDGIIDFDDNNFKKFRIRSLTTLPTTGSLYYSYLLKGV